MKRAALGFHMHSGWGVLVAVSGRFNSVDILDRRRIVTADPALPGAMQPYHYASQLELRSGEAPGALHRVFLSPRCNSIAEVIRELDGRHHRIVGAAVLLASGRSLPPLAKILACASPDPHGGR